tara:strand:- start:1462 stop:2478 length:1017 start_codon:yes stop_codon:yes gene_type:complete
MKNKYLVTGGAGFIGFHLCKKLLEKGENLICLDNINSYYDIKLKKDRLKNLNELNTSKNSWEFIAGDLEDTDLLKNLFEAHKPSIVIHLAAQAGVRYSIKNPSAYINSNVVGFFNILECCRNYQVSNLIYASSSSVYGNNKKLPFSETDEVNKPVSLYAATKKTNELMAFTYSSLYKIPTFGLRFFTVYGPWGRPDMAPMIFTNSIINKLPINIFNNGDMMRDFTYIDDIIELILKAIDKLSLKDNQINNSNLIAPAEIYNIGNSRPINLMEFINILEKEIGIKAIKNFKPMQPGDVKNTFSDTQKIEEWLGFKPNTEIEEGVKKFVSWYKQYYVIKN